MLGSQFVKFSMSILNWQVNSSSNFWSFFIVMTHKFPVNVKLIYFLLKIIKFLMSLLKRQVNSSQIFHHSSVSLLHCRFLVHSFCTLDKKIPWKCQFWHFFLVFWWKLAKFFISFSKPQVSFSFFLGQRYTLHERDQSKRKFFRFLSPRIKIHQILVIF